MEKENMTLLVNGKAAFPEIIRCIKNAKTSVEINMFIWRDDKIGNQMAEAVLNAADGGVKVYISVDRYGVVLEKCEESKKSFFHKKISLIEKIKINILKLLYPKNSRPGKVKDEHTEIYRHIKEHPNIDVSADVFKADHSKYYIIDEEVLFLGGINIEDKENGCDINGRFYGDYMVKLCGTGKRRSCYCDHSRKSQFSKRQQQADGQKTAESNKRTNCGLSLPQMLHTKLISQYLQTKTHAANKLFTAWAHHTIVYTVLIFNPVPIHR